MLANVVDLLFGCWHRNYSFPITAKKSNNNRPQAACITGTYVVCLDCGKEFPYDWNRMKVLSPKPVHTGATLTAAPVTSFGKVA